MLMIVGQVSSHLWIPRRRKGKNTLGSAFLALFFHTGGWDFNKLQQSLGSFENAMEHMDTYPDLAFHCAVVHTQLENYESALRGFQNCAWADPPLEVARNTNAMIRLLDTLDKFLKGCNRGKVRKGKIKRMGGKKSLPSLTSSLADINLKSSYERVGLDLLSEGLNNGVAVIGQVLISVKNEKMFPLYYVISDSNHICSVVTVYGIHNDAIKEGDQVTLLDPFYQFVDFSWKGKHYQFKSIRVNLVEQVRVNGNCLSLRHAVRTAIYAQLQA